MKAKAKANKICHAIITSRVRYSEISFVNKQLSIGLAK